MHQPPKAVRQFRFGVFEIDMQTARLRKRGRILRLQEQPLQVLVALIQRAGEVVSREDLQRTLWPAETFVAFDEGLNTAIKKIRQALGDSADNPRFIETVPRRGYRFIAPVHLLESETQPDTEVADPPVAIPYRSSIKSKRRWLWGIPVLCVSAGVGTWLTRGSPKAELAVIPVPLTSYHGFETSPSFSPDGNHVAFAWSPSENVGESNFDVYIKQMGGDEATRLTHSPGSSFAPAWSPDGRSIAFLRKITAVSTGIFVMPAIGGPERKLSEIHDEEQLSSYFGGALSWSADNQSLLVADQESFSGPTAIFRLSVETGEKRRVTSPPMGIPGDQNPASSPDGSGIAFTRCNAGDTCDLFLAEVTRDGSPSKDATRLTVGKSTSDPAWAPDGKGLVLISGPVHNPGLYWLELLQPGSRPGKLRRLVFAGEHLACPVISRQGRMAYSQKSSDVNIWQMELSTGRQLATAPVPVISSTRLDDEPRYSPDGERITFASDRSGSLEIWVCKRDGSGSIRLTSFGAPHHTAHPRWSPDGSRIAFTSNAGGTPSIYVINSEGGRPTRLPIEDALEWSLSEWSRDGKWLYYGSHRSGEDQLWKVPWPITDRSGPAVQVTKQGFTREAVESADGRTVYYLKGNGVVNESLWRVSPEDGRETQVLRSVLNNNFALGGKGIYYIPNAQPPTIHYSSFSGSTEVVVTILPRIPAWGFALSPDERKLLYSQWDSARADLMLVENFH